ncbi:vWA domain-containing protein [Williamsia muralis]|nr:VWA domain-containing protein [Williamsia marianensis]PVY30766.1 Mg-chelatase subunit ChlD [Williamsia marianensis]
MKPLRRKPKQLDEEPELLKPAAGGRGGFTLIPKEGPSGKPMQLPGSSAPGETNDEGELSASGGAMVIDEGGRRRARQIARRLALAQPMRQRRARRASAGTLTTMRWRGGTDELDLDATLEAIAGNPLPTDDDILVRERVRNRRSIVLVVDISGSTKGEQVRTAAATVGAMVGELPRDDVAVVAFWSDAALLVRLGERVGPETVLDQLLTLPAQGLTNVAFALEVAARELAGVPPADARVLLLSDCVHNAGPDPRGVAARLPRLDVLVDTSGENDLDLGRDLAIVGRGRCRVIRDHHDVAPALTSVFG